MTMNLRGYDVMIIASVPDPNIDSYTATKMFMRELAITYREAARMNEIEGYDFAAADLRTEANKISEALEVLGDV